MSADIPQELVDRMMVKCGRRCCICRRFNPTKLQVHHIQERAAGGSNDEDNLIVACITCHSDVHSKVPFCRRFTIAELKGHRNALISALESGQLPHPETEPTGIVQLIVARAELDDQLMPEAVEILIRAANASGRFQGTIIAMRVKGTLAIEVGENDKVCQPGDRRIEAKYAAALNQLVDSGLIEQLSEARYRISHPGYLKADEIAALGASQADQNAR